MTQRITDLSLRETFQRDIFRTRRGLDEVRREVSSGIRVNDPSDDPGRAGTIENFRNTLQRIDRHSQRISYATNFLDQQESVLGQANDLLVRAKEIATQGANETIGSQLRENLSREVFQLRDTLVNLGNTRVQGRYIYGGADDDDPPFDLSGTPYTEPASATDPASQRYVFDAENGTALQRSVSVSDFSNIQITTTGSSVFSNAIGALERLGRALAGYRTTPEDGSTLPTGGGAAFNLPTDYQAQSAAIRQSIDLLETARNDDIGQERVNVGGRLARIEVEDQILKTLKIDVEKSRSSIQDADVFDAASRLTQLETNFQATLAAGVRISNLSLLDFI